MKSRGSHSSEAPLYLVTGGAGFIGSHLAETLAISGQRVRILDDFSAGKKENLASVERSVELLEGDVTDLEACREACKGVEYILHSLPELTPVTAAASSSPGALLRARRSRTTTRALSASIISDSTISATLIVASPIFLSPRKPQPW